MADTRPWLKLWKCAFSDDGLASLTMEDRGRWLWLLLYVGVNGERGTITLPRGYEGLCKVLGAKDGLGVRRILRTLPGVEIGDALSPSQPATVTFTKWPKYQEDSSAERTKRWRRSRRVGDGVTPSHETVERDGKTSQRDGARREVEEKPPTSVPSPSQTKSADPLCPRGQRHGPGNEHPVHLDRVVIPNDGVPCYPSAELRAAWIHVADGCPRTEHLPRFPPDLRWQCPRHRIVQTSAPEVSP